MTTNGPEEVTPDDPAAAASAEELGESIFPPTRTFFMEPDLNKGVPPDPWFIRALSGVEIAVGVTLFAFVIFGTMYQVVGRYFPQIGWVGSGELALLSMIALTFTMAGYLVGRNGHIVLEIFDQLLAGKWLFTALRMISAVIMVAVCLALTYEAYVKLETEWVRLSAAMNLPLGILYIFALVGFASAAVQSAYKIRYANRPERQLDIGEMEG
ncbi:TRAP transporter small permease [Microbacterium sp. NPDC055910]|uniref:TRAP transporter small permease n=1 Tax=Microbacterium sp. NPDC055910 TaxID=3345659 RepID=UPI0035DD414E